MNVRRKNACPSQAGPMPQQRDDRRAVPDLLWYELDKELALMLFRPGRELKTIEKALR